MESTFRFDGQPTKFKTPSTLSKPGASEGSTSILNSATKSGDTSNGTPGETTKSRKPRITVTETDHLLLIRLCVQHKEEMREGNKMAFWNTIRQGFKEAAGKDLSSPRHPVDKLVEDRKAQLRGAPIQPQQQDDDVRREMNALVDEWIVQLDKVAEIEAANGTSRTPGPRSDLRASREKGKSVESQGPPAPQLAQKRTRSDFETPVPPPRPRDQLVAPVPNMTPVPRLEHDPQAGPRPPPQFNGPIVDDRAVNLLDAFIDEQENFSRNGPPPKRPRVYQERPHQDRMHQDRIYRDRLYHEPPQRVVVEGALTKEDWLEIAGHYSSSDPRVSQLEAKVDTLIETTKRTHQMLVQLLKNQAKRPGAAGVSDVQVNGDLPSGSQGLPP